MEEGEPNEGSDGTFGWLLGLFFVSGATALTYQTLWVRQLHLVFGTSTFAISTVLAAFMAGLALGGFVGGRYADRVERPLARYGQLEIGIGAFALVFPTLLSAATPMYQAVARSMSPNPVVFGLMQFALVGTLLLLPTALMGATLPLLARFATRRLGSAGDRIGTLYAVNTAGAVAGTFLCGFVLLPGLYLSGTTWLAAAANLALGLAAIAVDRSAPPIKAEAAEPPLAGYEADAMPAVLAAIGVAGFSALIYEVAWTRFLALMLGASTYTFSVMLLAFLVGIAIGGKLGGPVADRWMATGGARRVLLGFAAVEIGIATLSYALMYLYPELPFWYVWLFDAMQVDDYPAVVWAVSLVVAGLIMTPPAVLMGMHFPIAVRAAIGRSDELGAPVGRVYGANTLGGVFGAFLAGFVLLPSINVTGTLFVAALGELVAAAILIWWSGERRALAPAAAFGAAAVGLVTLAPPPWDPMLMTSGMYHYVTDFEDHSRAGIRQYGVEEYELLFYEEGLSSVVTVAKNRSTDNIWLANNGKVDASTTSDMPTQVLCSLLPIQFAPDPQDVLVIGLASGITAGAVSLVPEVDRLQVVELEPAIQRASEFFGAFNHDVLDNPKVELLNNDGRNHVLLSAPGSYDVIVSEPSNPWISGVSNLFTREFFELGKSRLKPGGVWSQWVQMYGMDTGDLRTLLRTFASVYPHVLLYSTIEEADLVLIGSESPLPPDLAHAQRLFAWPEVAKQLQEVGADEPIDLVSFAQMDRDAILDMVGDAELNTDDNMKIEYSAPLNLHRDTSEDNFNLMLRYTKLPTKTMPEEAGPWEALARSYHSRDDDARAIVAMQVAARFTADEVERQVLLDEALGWKAAMESEDEPDEDSGSDDP